MLLKEIASGDIICGRADKLFDECFSNERSNSSIKAVLKQYNNIPYNKEDIQQYCQTFNQGIRCYNEYAEKCISDPINRRLIEGEIMPARSFYEMLCKDNVFKKDYLKHRNCFRYIEKEWNFCTQTFHSLLDKEFTRVHRERKKNLIKFFSARYAYENCVGNSAKAKCKPESAIFTRSLVELLSSERQFKNCAKIENALCNSSDLKYFITETLFIHDNRNV
ncbi:CLUMA_CG013477, isoform A [Clunio marinus]|uniref:CLUMA_CG013477, isoform A n=1 Tax=Clunio marinus TaxID=568069 RepID=A0A1J1IJ03_9DIPT|nr:CLUMA_CG013477, isoform A [Clunio marinus]